MLSGKHVPKNDLIRNNADCRFKHLKLNSPTVSNKVYCEECRAWVDKEKGNICGCCSRKLVPKSKNLWLKRILNEGARQFSKEMEEWMWWNEDNAKVKTFKDKAKFSHKNIKFKYRKTVYELPMKFLVLSQVGLESEQVMLEMVREKIVVKGFELF